MTAIVVRDVCLLRILNNNTSSLSQYELLLAGPTVQETLEKAVSGLLV
jgi:hypothetical protein